MQFATDEQNSHDFLPAGDLCVSAHLTICQSPPWGEIQEKIPTTDGLISLCYYCPGVSLQLFPHLGSSGISWIVHILENI